MKLLALLTMIACSLSTIAASCNSLNKVPICHSGVGASGDNAVEVCPDFGALWGHIVQHPSDTIGECGVNLEENLKVWACNAGIKHADHLDGACFDMNQGGVKVESCQDLNNCVCSGDSLPQSLFEFDYMKFAIAPYYKGQIQGPFLEKNVTAGQFTFAQATREQGSDKLDEDTGASFFLGSERFGAQYFADICGEFLDKRLEKTPMKISLNLFLAEDLFNSGEGYLDTAEVSQKSAIFCDKNSKTGPYRYSSSPIMATTELPYNGGSRELTTIDKDSRSCFARMLFKENQKDILRPYDLKRITLHSKLTVTPEGVLPGGDEPIEFCHVRKIRGNQYECNTLSFPNTASLRSYMQTGYSNIRDWSQDHGFDYRGACRQTCGPLTGNQANL
jgi:hypothetical protein